jgi:hypothetical protein
MRQERQEGLGRTVRLLYLDNDTVRIETQNIRRGGHRQQMIS